MDPAVGCFVSCMPTWTPLAKPLQRVPTVLISLCNLITRSRSHGRKMGTMLPGESGEFQLPQYRQDSGNAVITTVAGIPSEHLTPVPQAGKAMIRKLVIMALCKPEWLVILPDNPGTSDTWRSVREEHLAAVKQHFDAGLFRLGGAYFHPREESEAPLQVRGSVVIACAESKEEVVEVLKRDVFTTSGVWDWGKVEIYPFRTALTAGGSG
ncbi:MAG: hypothetical protein Q9157_008160 [Trypethelium eluteriae]